MQNCGSTLYDLLKGNQYDLPDTDLFEFYPGTELDLCPANAEKRFAATALQWFGYNYERQAINRDNTRRYIDGQFNGVSISLSNVDRTVGQWLSETQLEGYRIIVRAISRSIDDDSVVLGVYRCEKPKSVNNTLVQITGKQDLGTIEANLPFEKVLPKCGLKFKKTGGECLGGQDISEKSAAYQAATVCNKSVQQCKQYENYDFFQGEIFTAVTGNFKVSQKRGGAGGAVLGLFGLGNKRVTKQYSSQDASSLGSPVPIGGGRTQIELVPLQYADTGEYLAGQWLVGRGPITKLLNLRNVTSGWADTFQALATHLGNFGNHPDQAPLGFFASQGQKHSRRAYVEATIKGENPDTGDPAPTLACVVLWTQIPKWDGTQFSDLFQDFSDNAVEQLRWLITHERGLNYNPLWIDDLISGQTVEYCNEPLIDQSGGEDVYVSTASGTPGTDYKRYRSTGLLDKYFFLKELGLTSTYPAERESTYNTFNPAGPEVVPALGTYYRKRYTSNWHIREQKTLIDFIYKDLMPSSRLYLVTSAQGKLQIKTKRPAITSFIRDASIIGATTVTVEDALVWRNLDLPQVFVLVGAGLATSETAIVSSVDFSTAGNSITLSASGSATESGVTLAGGTTTIQAAGTVTISGTSSATVLVDGIDVSYVSGADDTSGTIAAGVATRINANPTLSRYVEAIWTPTLPNQVLIRSKLGVLNLAAGLEFAHDAAEKAVHIHLPFADVAMGALTHGNIAKDGYEWPLGSRRSSYNQFFIEFQDAPQDFQTQPLFENDDDHQEKVQRTNKYEVSGACVDNYHQASRLVVAERYEKRQGDYFGSIQTNDGRAMLLEEGDIICVTHSNQPGQRNLLQRVEELNVSPQHKTSIIARLYADDQFPDTAEERTVPLVTGIGFPSAVPEAVTNVVLSVPSPGTLHVEFDFTPFLGTQTARIEVKRDGETVFSDTGLRISPDGSNHGVFELSGLILGTASVRITPFSTAGDGPSTEATYAGGFGFNFGASFGG